MGPGLGRLVLTCQKSPGLGLGQAGSFTFSRCFSGNPAKLLYGWPSIQLFKCISCLTRRSHTNASEPTASTPPHLYSFHPEFPEEHQLGFLQSFLVLEDVVTEDEEAGFMKEMEPHLKRHIYEKDHWDDAIVGFRETERKIFNATNTPLVERIKRLGFPTSGKESRTLPYAHVLDLADWGHIKPHIDSSRFCGSTVAVLSLLSPCLARFRLDKEREKMVDVLIPRRSLYIMKGFSRYDCTHEVLPNKEAVFKGEEVVRSRRISLVCRNEA